LQHHPIQGRSQLIVSSCCAIFAGGQNYCNLVLHRTTKYVFENFVRCNCPVAMSGCGLEQICCYFLTAVGKTVITLIRYRYQCEGFFQR